MLAADASQVAATPEPRIATKPLLAARDDDRRKEIVARVRAFQQAYARALARWRDGLRDVVFPLGTYAMRVMHGVICVAPPTAPA